MGTKKQLVDAVEAVTLKAKEGAFLDLFCGVCSVGSRIADTRIIWANDKQVFATEVARHIFKSKINAEQVLVALCYLTKHYLLHLSYLNTKFKHFIEEEMMFIRNSDIDGIRAFYQQIALSNIETKSHSYFTNNYSGTYFGIKQAIEIDSVKYAISKTTKSKYFNIDIIRLFNLCLCKSVFQISTITGHFAQYLNINNNNSNYYFKKRSKSIFSEFEKHLELFQKHEKNNNISNNKIFQDDALNLLDDLLFNNEKPAIVYADPPYTSDQYSRYYHLLETLILYDYPCIEFKAKYRNDRFTSTFSLKTKVLESLKLMIKKVSALESDLILSYPTNGLINEAKNTTFQLLGEHYSKVSLEYEIRHQHSSFGASKGQSKNEVSELIFYATNPSK